MPSPPRPGRIGRGIPAAAAVTFSEVRTVAMMLASSDLLSGLGAPSLLGGLATDDSTMRACATPCWPPAVRGQLQTTAERLMLHKNGPVPDPHAGEILGPAGWASTRHYVELALLAHPCWARRATAVPRRLKPLLRGTAEQGVATAAEDSNFDAGRPRQSEPSTLTGYFASG